MLAIGGVFFSSVTSGGGVSSVFAAAAEAVAQVAAHVVETAARAADAADARAHQEDHDQDHDQDDPPLGAALTKVDWKLIRNPINWWHSIFLKEIMYLSYRVCYLQESTFSTFKTFHALPGTKTFA